MTTRAPALDALRGVVRIAKAASIGVTGNTPRIANAEAALADVDALLKESKEALTCLRVYAPQCAATIVRLDEAIKDMEARP